MNYLIIILFSYIIGSSSMSYYISRIKNIDITTKGSKNLGASNTVALIGWKAGALVFIHDFGKAMLAIYLTRIFFGDVLYGSFISGVSCVLGHIFPFYLKGKGGKGFASYVGMSMMLDWKFTLCLILVVILITLITDYIVLGTFTSMITVPTYFGVITHDINIVLILCVASLVIIYKHRENIPRILNGTEIGLRSANKGEHRVK